MSHLKSDFIKNIILVVTSVIFTLLIVEIGFRIIKGKLFDTTLLTAEYAETKQEDVLPRAQYDEYLGWVPNLGERQEKIARHTIIEGNIRSNGVDAPASFSSSKTILVVGDSFAFGEEVHDHKTWPAQLEVLANTKVINGAVFNYGFDQIVMRAELLVKEHDPDILLVGLIPDDIFRCEQAIRMHAKPFFLLENNELVLKNNPVPLPDEEKVKPKNFDLFRRYFGYSHLVDFIMRRVNILYWLDQRIVMAMKKTEIKGMKNTNGDDIACALVDRLVKIKNERNIALVMVVQYERHLGVRGFTRGKKLIQCAQNKGMNTLDFYEPLHDVKMNNPDRFKQLFGIHMSARGNAFIAAGVHRYLKEQKIVDYSRFNR